MATIEGQVCDRCFSKPKQPETKERTITTGDRTVKVWLCEQHWVAVLDAIDRFTHPPVPKKKAE